MMSSTRQAKKRQQSEPTETELIGQYEGSVHAIICITRKASKLNDYSNAKALQTMMTTIVTTPLHADKDSMKLERDARHAVESFYSITLPQARGLYTEPERRQALFKVATSRDVSRDDIINEFGVPMKTQCNDLKALRLLLGLAELSVILFNVFRYDETNCDLIREAVEDMAFETSGPSRLCPHTERDLLAMQMEMCDKSGYGMDQSQQGAYLMDYCASKARELETENDDCETALSKRLKTAKISRHFIKSNFGSGCDIEMVGAKAKYTKNSEMSFKRAAAACPTRSSTMTRKFQDGLAALIARGVFPPEGPKPSQVEGMDEMGFDAWGKVGKVCSYFKRRGERRMCHRHGEHAPFHASVAFGADADGNLENPTITHQGGTSTSMTSSCALNLDPRFEVDQTPSGYFTQETFRLCAATMAKDKVPKIVYMDGHESHFDPDAGDFLLKHNIFPFFLKSNDSVNDAAMDNGPNAMVKGAYRRHFNKWKCKNPGEPLTPSIFNKVFTDAWHEVENSPRRKEVIQHAFAKTLTWPLVDVLADESVNEAACLQKFEHNMAISAIFRTDEADNARLAAAQQHSSVTPIVPVTIGAISTRSSSGSSVIPSITAIRGTIPGRDTPEYSILVHSASIPFFTQSWLTPAHENERLRKEEKAARKVRVRRPCLDVLEAVEADLQDEDEAAEDTEIDSDQDEDELQYGGVNVAAALAPIVRGGGLPDTTTGLVANSMTFSRIREAKKQKALEAQGALEKRTEKVRLQGEAYATDKQQCDVLITKCNEQPLFDWRKETMPFLKAAHKCLPNAPVVAPTPGANAVPKNKGWYIEQLEARMQIALQARVVIAVPVGIEV
jgi:hypothetical protein